VIVNVDHLLPGDPTAPSFGPRMACTKFGTIGSARNKSLAAGLAGLGLPSDFHDFQGKGKTRAKRVEPGG
jgi:hypothetical protein